MFKGISTRLLQHLITQNSWANSLLQPHAGKSVQFTIPPVHGALVILENGNLAIAGETNAPDATIIIAPSLLLRLIAKDDTAKLQIKVEGDTGLATAMAKVLDHMRWDYESDLSKLIGDVPAYKISEFGRNTSNTIKQTGVNIASMLTEYWQEEKPMLAKKRHIEQFNTDVDDLRAGVERLEKRLQKLAQSMSSNTILNTPVTDSTQ